MLNHLRTTAGTLKRGCIGFVQDRTQRECALPDSVHTKAIGKSVGGKNIWQHQIGGSGKHIMICGAIHGNEVGTTKLAREILRWFADNQDLYPQIRLSSIPCLNLDGYAEAKLTPNYLGGGRIGRCNGNGIDLNRNFPTRNFQPTANWNHGKFYSDETPQSAGAFGGSEPETKALMHTLTEEKPDLLIMYHSVGSDVMGTSDEKAQNLAMRYAHATKTLLLPHDYSDQLGQTGTVCQWCTEQGIPCLEIETASRWGSDFARQIRGLESGMSGMSEGG